MFQLPNVFLSTLFIIVGELGLLGLGCDGIGMVLGLGLGLELERPRTNLPTDHLKYFVLSIFPILFSSPPNPLPIPIPIPPNPTQSQSQSQSTFFKN